MSLKTFLLVICVVISSVICEKARYDNYKVYSFPIENQIQLENLQQLELNPEGYLFWDSPVQINMNINIVVPPHKFSHFEEFTNTLNIKTKLMSRNLQELFDNERPKIKPRVSFGWEDYYPLKNIYEWIDQNVAKYPTILSVQTIGKTYEKRDMKVVKLSHKEGNPGIFIETNIHAREWITSATVTWILNELLTSKDKAVQDLAQNFDWYILPVTNPDGFEYSHTADRVWRKTRFPHTPICAGADGNRNFDYNWMFGGGATPSPCTETYGGPKPESEVEIKNLVTYYRSIASKITLYLSFHSFGQYILLPYGHKAEEYPDNYSDMMEIAERAVVDLYRVNGVPYIFGTTADVLYDASGISIDWVRGNTSTPLSYTFEFRDQGNFGFILPAAQIVPNAKEVLAALVGMVGEARKLSYF